MQKLLFLPIALSFFISTCNAGDKIFGFGELGVTTLDEAISQIKQNKCPISKKPITDDNEKAAYVTNLSASGIKTYIRTNANCLTLPEDIKDLLASDSTAVLMFDKNNKLSIFSLQFSMLGAYDTIYSSLIKKYGTPSAQNSNGSNWERSCNSANCPDGYDLVIQIRKEKLKCDVIYSLRKNLMHYL